MGNSQLEIKNQTELKQQIEIMQNINVSTQQFHTSNSMGDILCSAYNEKLKIIVFAGIIKDDQKHKNLNKLFVFDTEKQKLISKSSIMNSLNLLGHIDTGSDDVTSIRFFEHSNTQYMICGGWYDKPIEIFKWNGNDGKSYNIWIVINRHL
jgi:hypothetical protein